MTILTREQRIAWVAWHEFVHRGADYYRQVWGGKEWQTTLSKLRNNSALRHLAEAIQAERNAAYLNSGQDVRVTPEQAMEEALAELSAAIEQGNADALIARYGRFAPTTGRTRLQALLGKMADVIRRVLGRITKRQITQEELSDADAIGLLRDITALQGADNLADARTSAGVAARETPPAQAAERAVQRQERMPPDGAAYSTAPQVIALNGDEIAAGLNPDNIIKKTHDWFKENLQGKTIHRDGLGDISISYRSWKKLRQGIKMNPLKARLFPAIPAILQNGEYRGRQPIYKTRNDGIVAFHFVVGNVDLAGQSIPVAVSVGEMADGKLVYNLTENPERFYNEETARGIPREQDRDTGGSRLTGGEDSIGADGLNINLPDNGGDVHHSTAPDTLRKHTAASDLETVTDTLLTNARSDGSRANTHSVDTIDDSTPQSATSQGVRHSTTPSLDEAADSAFARAVDDVVAGKVPAGYISLGTTPEVLKLIGVPDGKVRISGGTIEKAMASYLNRNNSYDENRHAIRPEDMKQLPAHLNDPIAVFKSATRADSFVVLTELMERENGRDKPVIAALHLQKGKRGLNLVDIASVYGRSNGQLVRAFDTDLLYLNKQKGRQFLTTHPLQLHWDITSDADLSARNIKTNEDLTQEAGGAQTADNSGVVHHSTAPQAYTRDLIATHNISAAGILHADRLGGLPWASFAVTRADRPLTGFGDVTLIGDRGLADPQGRKKAKVFGADIYSPRQPRPVYKIGRDAIDTMWAPFARLAERFKEDTRRDLDSYAHDTDAVRADDIRHTLSRSPAVRYTFLAQRGEQPSLHELNGTARDIEERLRQVMEENGAENDFNDYVDDLWESLGGEPRLFKGYTDMGNRRFGRYDLASIAAIMKRNLRGGESGNYGTGHIRAHVTPQFKTLKAIRAGKARLTDGETFRRLRDEVDNEAAKIGDTLGIHDETDFLKYVATDGWAKAVEGRAALDTPQNRRLVENFLAKLADMPTEYFEGKLPGITQFSDFTAAVVPHDLDARAREVLENAGLRLFAYSDGESRSRAIEAAARTLDEERGGDILFSTTPEQRQTLRLASNRILNIARTIQNGGKYISGEPIDLGTTPPVYQALGAEALPLKVLNPRKLFSLLRPKSEQGQRGDNTHELTPELLAQVPQALQEPSLVFDSEQPGALVAVTSLQDNKGNPVVAAIHLGRAAGFLRINKIASIYGKDHAARVFNRWQKEGKLRYVDTKNPSLLTSDGVQFSQEKSAKESGRTVLTDADVVKLQQQAAQTEAETKTGQALFSTVWHGTPYRGIENEGFDLGRIGTGEGAQAYGWGIYFAGDRDVSEEYRRRLSDSEEIVNFRFGDEPFIRTNDGWRSDEHGWQLEGAEEVAANAITDGTDLAALIAEAEEDEMDVIWDGHMEVDLDTAREAAQMIANGDIEADTRQGQLYSAEIPEDEELLDWDDAYSKQPQDVQEKIRRTLEAAPQRALEDYSVASGQELADKILGDDPTGSNIYNSLDDIYGSDREASLALNDNGIPGLRYLDGNSRRAGEGSHNYVIWDDALLTPEAAQIEAMYSIPPQLVSDPPTQEGLAKRIMQAFTDPTVRDLWFDRQGELDRILRADPDAKAVRNAFKMYNARVQHILEGVPQTMIQDLGKALAAHFQEAEKRIPNLQNMKANKKVRQQMFMDWLDGVGKYINTFVRDGVNAAPPCATPVNAALSPSPLYQQETS